MFAAFPAVPVTLTVPCRNLQKLNDHNFTI